MKRVIRPTVAILAVLPAAAAASPAAHTTGGKAKPFRAAFTETVLTRTADCTVEPLICQAVAGGTGSVQHYGSAKETAGITQDRGVTPCGAGSDSEAYTRRITTDRGVLAMRAGGRKCPVSGGYVVRARYRVDGAASTGVFAGARGSGVDTVEVPAGKVVIRGWLRLRCARA